VEVWPLATDVVCAGLAPRRLPDKRTLRRAPGRLRSRDLSWPRRGTTASRTARL
jgi:hypothetical protein